MPRKHACMYDVVVVCVHVRRRSHAGVAVPVQELRTDSNILFSIFSASLALGVLSEIRSERTGTYVLTLHPVRDHKAGSQPSSVAIVDVVCVPLLPAHAAQLVAR
jgi:hypothetical protein